MKILKTIKGAHGNKIEFQEYDNLGPESIVVYDCDCQRERTYTIGFLQELDDFEEVIIKSIGQVIRAWEQGTIWF